MKQVNYLKTISFMCLTAILFSAVSCKKETVDTVPTVTLPAKKLKQISDSYDGQAPDITKITYDASGRIATYIINPDKTNYYNYVSSTSLIITDKKNSDNSLVQTRECTINSSGYVDKILYKNNAGLLTYTYEYVYDAEGNMIKVKGVSTAGTTYQVDYTYVNGVPSSYKVYNDGVQSSNTQLTFDESKPNKLPYTVGGGFLSYNLFGKTFKYCIKEFKTYNMSGTLTYHGINDIQTDAQGFLTKLTTTYVLTGKKSIADYTVE